ncbi:Histidine kinase [Micromonospora citrea]|uniref:histidine kinase n=1 Tax=Micromonospora citrea TaxID=47855 RepID=A0A1C6VIT0_9ACTN|nr:sensor histidine kinase [Micromonospora citrea]SCL66192.1 Histidine kinase [Micromonospora citrea]
MNMSDDPDAGRRRGSRARWLPPAPRELWTVAADPLPPLPWPRWAAGLPHVLVVVYAALLFVAFHGIGRPTVVLTGVQAAAVVLAMFRPVPAWWAVTVTAVVGPLAVDAPSPWSRATIAALAGVLFLLALRTRPLAVFTALGVSVLAGLASVGFHVHNHSPDAGWPFRPLHTDVGQVVAICGLAACLGGMVRARRVARTRLVAQELVSAEERARRTLLEERARIARELHDVVAHHLSVISIQAQVAPHLVTDPPEELRQNLAGIRGNALEALTELRRVLGVLRVERPADAGHAPQPTLARLPELVGNVRDAGLDVTTRTTGRPRPLPPGVELSAYRIVQEALSNAIRHAPGATVRVELAYHPTSLVVQVGNTPPTRPAPPSAHEGHGLLGMRERAAMLGGTLTAGPTPDGGYEVTADLPAPTCAPTAEEAA